MRVPPRNGLELAESKTVAPSESTNDATRREWRELGFYYEVCSEPCRWDPAVSPPLHLEVRIEGFDPASADELLSAAS